MKTKFLLALGAILLGVALFPFSAAAAEPAPINVQKRGDGSSVMLGAGVQAPLLVIGTSPTGAGTLRIAAGGTLDIQAGAIVNFPTGFIPWAAVNKTGSSLADLATRSAADLSTGTLLVARLPAFAGGDVSSSAGSAVLTLAAVASAGTTGSSTAIPVITIDAKGRTTLISTAAVIAPAGTLSGGTLAANVLASSLTSVGTLTGGATGTGFTVNLGTSTISGVLLGVNGGTGVANSGKTMTLGGNFAMSGAFTFTGTVTGNTAVTFPTSGTLATTAGTVASVQGTAGQILANGLSTPAQTGAVVLTLPTAITGINSITFASGSSLLDTSNTIIDVKRQGGAAAGGFAFWDATNTAIARVIGSGGNLLVTNGNGGTTYATFASGSLTLGSGLALSVPNTTPSTSTVTGAVTTVGGLGVGGQGWFGGQLNTVAISNTGGISTGTIVATANGNSFAGTSSFGSPFTAVVGSGSAPFYFGYNTTTAAGGITLSKNPLLQLFGAGDANTPPLIGLVQLAVNVAGGQAQAGLELAGTRRANSNSAAVAVANGDNLGRIQWLGDDGTNLRTVGASINATVDTTNVAVGTGVIPASLTIATIKNAPINFQVNSANVGQWLSTGLSVLSTTGSSSTTTGSGIFAGGIGVAGAGFFGNKVSASEFDLIGGGTIIDEATGGIRIIGGGTGNHNITLTPTADGIVTIQGQAQPSLSITSNTAGITARVRLQGGGSSDLAIGGGFSGTVTSLLFGVNVASTTDLSLSSSQMRVLLTTASSSTTTGALRVDGGVGVAGAGFFGAGLNASGTAAVYTGTSTLSGNGDLMNIYAASLGTAPNFGSVRFGKGASTGDSAALSFGYTGANNAANTFTLGFFGITSLTFTRGSSNGDAAFASTTDASSSTTGALTTAGGLGVAKKAYIGGNLLVWNGAGTGVSISASSGIITANPVSGSDFIAINGKGTGSVDLNHGDGTGGTRFLNGASTVVASVSSTGLTNINDTTNSTSTNSGSLQTLGGVGIAKDLVVGQKITQYNGLNTAGNGVASIQGAGRVTAQTAANASVATYTVGASDASFIVSANVLVTTSTLHTFTVTCAYTDEGNTARTVTFNFQTIGGTIGTSIANAGGAVPYEGVPIHIRAKASTAITIATTGTFTTVTYNAEGVITKLQ